MALMQLDTVYATYASLRQGAEPGSIEVKGGTANVYFSNSDSQPANAAAMTLDAASPLSGVFQVIQGARWILVEQATLAPVVKEFRAAVVV